MQNKRTLRFEPFLFFAYGNEITANHKENETESYNNNNKNLINCKPKRRTTKHTDR